MLWRIIKKDLSHQLKLYFVLFILIFLSISLFCSSLCIVYYSTFGVSNFLAKSNLSDIIIIKQGDKQENENIVAWAKSREDILNLDIKPAFETTNIIFSSNKILPEGINLMIMEQGNTQNLLFDELNQILTVPEGGIAFPVLLKQQLGLKIGDIVTFKSENQQLSFVISGFFKDALMGSNGMSSKRAILNHIDIENFFYTMEQEPSYVVQILLNDLSSFEILSDYQKEGFNISYSFQKDTIYTIYMASNGIIAILLVLTALFILIIVIFCLYFSISSTLSEDIGQIGFLQAIGMTSNQVSKLYILKYAFISAVASLFGSIFGYFLSHILIYKMLNQILPISQLIPILLSVLVASLLFGLCIMCCKLFLNHIKTFTPVSVLCGRDNSLSNSISQFRFLHKQKKLSTIIFIAFNDICCNIKSYAVLIITFIGCIMLMAISLNFSNSLSGDELVKYFGCTPADFYYFPKGSYNTAKEVISIVHSLEQEFIKNDEPIKTGIDYNYEVFWQNPNGDEGLPITALKSSKPVTNFSFIEGNAPIEANEIALTTILLKQYGIQVGDICTFRFEGENTPRQFKISGSFQAMYNMGELILLNQQFYSKSAIITGVLPLITLEQKNINSNAIINYLMNKYDELGEIKIVSEYVSQMTGGLDKQILNAVVIICIISTIILAFMIVANAQIFIYKDTQIIAMLKAIGLSSNQIFIWQGTRIGLLIIFSILVGIIFANTIGEKVMQKLFSFTGLTDLVFSINIIHIYLLLPIYIIGICLVCLLPILNSVKKIQIEQIRIGV